MFGLTLDKLLIICVIAVFIVGPTRLPLYAEKLATAVRALRSFVTAAQARVSDELGPEFDVAEWRRLDPRQYDPRQIIRDALREEPTARAAPRERESGRSNSA
ncbi:MAG TPA: Sec-independent protein translocase TatB [Plantibacter sp.]|uniref:Sec-independent protein translocase TatB n=1 Tax=unclassified Plantibacter TaxID=2624265 RepID=UPI002CDA3345|nr:Sec-independent protein translocase TatB [Plantibacter sp.]